MEFRPCSSELLSTCVKTEFCTECKLRIGCPIRRDFYAKLFKSDIAFEVMIQSLELDFSKIYNEDDSFRASDALRRKYYEEKRINPHFSYL